MTHGTSWVLLYSYSFFGPFSPFLFSIRTPVTEYIYSVTAQKLTPSGHWIYIFSDRFIHFCKHPAKWGWGNLRGGPKVWIKGVTHPLARYSLLANFYEKSKLPREKWMSLREPDRTFWRKIDHFYRKWTKNDWDPSVLASGKLEGRK